LGGDGGGYVVVATTNTTNTTILLVPDNIRRTHCISEEVVSLVALQGKAVFLNARLQFIGVLHV
jgi:hypothetical protein